MTCSQDNHCDLNDNTNKITLFMQCMDVRRSVSNIK